MQNSEINSPKHDLDEARYVLHRRFDRMGRLVGDENMQKLFCTHVMVIGLGGVGSWAAESLTRSGVGKVTVIDFDEICITNANRQLHALQGLIGQKKSAVMAERLRRINPQAQIIEKSEFYQSSTSEDLLADRPDYILDCIDNLTAKAFLLSEAKKRNIRVITATGAAARLDPSQVQIVDLSRTHTDPMAAQLRKILRQKYDFSECGDWGIAAVFSAEKPLEPVELKYDLGQGFKCVCPQGQNNLHSCDSRNLIYGTASFVTGAFGLQMASWVVRNILNQDEAQ